MKLGSVALWEHLVKISGHSDCRLTSSNVLDMIERVSYMSRIGCRSSPFDHTAVTAMRVLVRPKSPSSWQTSFRRLASHMEAV